MRKFITAGAAAVLAAALVAVSAVPAAAQAGYSASEYAAQRNAAQHAALGIVSLAETLASIDGPTYPLGDKYLRKASAEYDEVSYSKGTLVVTESGDQFRFTVNRKNGRISPAVSVTRTSVVAAVLKKLNVASGGTIAYLAKAIPGVLRDVNSRPSSRGPVTIEMSTNGFFNTVTVGFEGLGTPAFTYVVGATNARGLDPILEESAIRVS